MPRQEEGRVEHPELQEVERLTDEIIGKLQSNPNMPQLEARDLALSMARAKRAYYTTVADIDYITLDVDGRPFDVATWDIAITHAKAGNWTSLSALLNQEAQPFLTDELGAPADLSLGVAYSNLSRIVR